MNDMKSIGRRDFMRLAGAALVASRLPAAPAKRYRVVDTHFHMFNSALQGTNGIPKYMPDATVETCLRMMDAGQVDKAFLIGYNAADIAAEIRGRGQSPVTMMPVINAAYQFASWKAHKDRFYMFPSYCNPLQEDLAEKLDRWADMGISGMKLMNLFYGVFPDHPGLNVLYDFAQRRKKPIILDPSWWYLGRPQHQYGFNESRERQKMAESWTSYEGYAKLMDDVFSRYPTVPFSIAHAGTAKKKEDYEHIFPLIKRHKNVSCDIGMVNGFGVEFLKELVGAVGASRVMYGTDAPYWWKEPESYLTGRFRWTLIADECPFLSEQEKQAILAGNAERFIRFQLPVA